MTTKHTPGPWTVHPRDGIPAVGIDVGDGGDLLPIVDVVHGRTKAEARRNRTLIAEAPALLDELKRCRDELWRLLDVRGIPPQQIRQWPEIQRADALIAKLEV